MLTRARPGARERHTGAAQSRALPLKAGRLIANTSSHRLALAPRPPWPCSRLGDGAGRGVEARRCGSAPLVCLVRLRRAEERDAARG